MANKVGKPLALNTQVIEVISNCIMLGMRVQDATRSAGIHSQTYHKWMQKAQIEKSNRELGITDPNKDIFIKFIVAIEEAKAKGQKMLLQKVYRDAFEPKVQKTTKREYDGNGNLIKETVSEVEQPPDSKSAKWILERRWREDYSRHTVNHTVDWQENVKNLLKLGTVKREELEAEIGEELVEALFGSGSNLLEEGDIEYPTEPTVGERVRNDEGGDFGLAEGEGTASSGRPKPPKIIDVADFVSE